VRARCGGHLSDALRYRFQVGEDDRKRFIYRRFRRFSSRAGRPWRAPRPTSAGEWDFALSRRSSSHTRAKKESANRSPPVSTGWADGPPAHSPRKVVPRIPESSKDRPVQGSSAFFCEINLRTRSANSAPSNGFLNASLNPSAKVSSPGSSLVKASRIVPT
jgi:hypothetical protein